MVLQRLHDPLRHLGDLAAELALVAVDEVPDQARDVLGPLAQRRQADRIHAQPVEEVGPEPALGDERLEVVVGCRYDPEADLAGPRRADALELAFLQDAEEPDLTSE